jgi:hypothetical protein
MKSSLLNCQPNYLMVLQVYTVSSILLFLPFILDVNPAFEYNTNMVPAITSSEYGSSQIIMITASLTLLTEALIDAQCDFKLALCRLILLFSLLVPSSLTLGCSSLSNRRKVQLFVCCFEWRNSLVAGAFIAAMVEIKTNKKTRWLLYIMSVVSLACFQFWLWESFIPRTALTSGVSLLLNFLYLSCIMALAVSSVMVLWRSGRKLSVEDKYSVIFSFALTLNFLGKFTTFFAYNTKSWGDIHVNEILIFCGCDVVFGTVAFILTMRIERERAYIAKVRKVLWDRSTSSGLNIYMLRAAYICICLMHMLPVFLSLIMFLST